MHQFFYSPPDPLDRLRVSREYRIKIEILRKITYFLPNLKPPTYYNYSRQF